MLLLVFDWDSYGNLSCGAFHLSVSDDAVKVQRKQSGGFRGKGFSEG